MSEHQPQNEAGENRPRPRRRRLVVGLVVTALVLGAAGTGIGVTVSRVATADRQPGPPRWRFPSGGHDAPAGTGHRGVGVSLLPYPDGYEAGPDLDEFGSDKEFSEREATALRKKSLRVLPLSRRRSLEREIDRQKVTSMAVRSYASGDKAAGGIVATVSLYRMRTSGVARSLARSQAAAFDAIGVPNGPTVHGNGEARCYLMPSDTDEKLEKIFCSAHRGDVLVTLAASGTKKNPVDGARGNGLVGSGEPVKLLRAQLDRLGNVGEAI
ncbi:hypothetical protein [Streptomyces sp. NPDC049813]|uniref:hypothetical protein n=1 Tax=Streptomyces sp. NPDC049813 TaxID=3365597 RepID=UPI0037B1D62A